MYFQMINAHDINEKPARMIRMILVVMRAVDDHPPSAQRLAGGDLRKNEMKAHDRQSMVVCGKMIGESTDYCYSSSGGLCSTVFAS
jgi:hypothetical protein